MQKNKTIGLVLVCPVFILLMSVALAQQCIDTDGLETHAQGTVSYQNISYIDSCIFPQDEYILFFENFEGTNWERFSQNNCDNTPNTNLRGNFTSANDNFDDFLFCVSRDTSPDVSFNGTYGLLLEDWDGGSLTNMKGLWKTIVPSVSCGGAPCDYITVSAAIAENGLDFGENCWITQQLNVSNPTPLITINSSWNSYKQVSVNLTGLSAATSATVRIMCKMNSNSDEVYIDDFKITGYKPGQSSSSVNEYYCSNDVASSSIIVCDSVGCNNGACSCPLTTNTLGDKICSGNTTYQVFEQTGVCPGFGQDISCDTELICSSGECVCPQTNNNLNDTRCDSATSYQVFDNYSTCPSWGPSNECAIGEVCLSGVCQIPPPECTVDLDCGTPGFVDDLICQDNNVWKLYKTPFCSSEACGNNSEYQEFELCTNGCNNGACIPDVPTVCPSNCTTTNCANFGNQAGNIQLMYGANEDNDWAVFANSTTLQQFHNDVHHQYIRTWFAAISYRPSTFPLLANGSYNWVNSDKFVEAVLATGAKPFILLAHGDRCNSNTPFSFSNCEGYGVLPPSNNVAFGAYAANVTQHYVDKYGVDEVNTWYFEILNEPFGWNDYTPYWDLFRISEARIKAIAPGATVGAGPYGGVPGAVNAGFDFLDFHLYPENVANGVSSDQSRMDATDDMATKINSYKSQANGTPFISGERNLGLSNSEYSDMQRPLAGSWEIAALVNEIKANVTLQMTYMGTCSYPGAAGCMGMWHTSGVTFKNYATKKVFTSINPTGTPYYQALYNNQNFEVFPTTNGADKYITVVNKRGTTNSLNLEIPTGNVTQLTDLMTNQTFNVVNKIVPLSFTAFETKFLKVTAINTC